MIPPPPPGFVVTQLRTPVAYAGAIGAIAVDPHDVRRVVVASVGGGVFSSRDGARTWKHEDSLASTRVEALAYSGARLLATAAQAFDVRGSGGVWSRAAAPGSRWSRSAAVFPPGCAKTASAWGIDVSPAAHRTYVATDCGFAFAAIGGARWRALPIVGAAPPFLSIVALGSGRIIAGGPNGFWYSRNDGVTWAAERTGIGGTSSVRALARDPRGGAAAYAVDDAKRLYQTRDGGITWQRIEADAGGFSCGGTAFVKAVRGGSGVALYFGNRCTASVTAFGVREQPAATGAAWTALNATHPDVRDVAFAPGSGKPMLLTTDGGVDEVLAPDRIRAAGGPADGLDALQVNEVAGQYVGGARDPDLYFATQDNAVWASSGAAGVASLLWEGFYLGVERSVADQRDARVTYAICGGCKNGIAGWLFGGAADWRDVTPHQRAPVLVSHGTYLQQTGVGTTSPGIAFTNDSGATWRTVATIAQPMRGNAVVAGPSAAPVAYQPVQTGAHADGTEIVRLVRLSDVTSSSPVKRFAAMQNFDSLGVAPAAFASYEVLGVDPRNPAHLIAPDAGDGDVKASFDGGDHWSPIAGLRDLVSHGGRYAMGLRDTDRVATLISVASFCPDDASRVLLGTRAGGAYYSNDGGTSWHAVPESQPMTFATSVFWLRDCRAAWISTYGRGIWNVAIDDEAPPGTPVSAAFGSGLTQLPPVPLPAPSVTVTSGTIEEGQRVLDPHDPLNAEASGIPSTGRYVLALDGRVVTPVPAGLPLLRYSATPEFWPLGRHALALVDVSGRTPRTLATTEFLVP